jgi:hypothetical protein
VEGLSLSLDGLTDNSSNFSFVGKSNSIFEVISTTSLDYYGNPDIKMNFINTFY